MNRKFCFFLLATLMLVSCEKDMSPFSGSISYDDAAAQAMEILLAQNSRVAIYGWPEMIQGGSHLIRIGYYINDTLLVEKDSWLFIAKQRYRLNSSYCTFLLIDIQDGKAQQQQFYTPDDLSGYDLLYPRYDQPLSRETAAAEFLDLALPAEEKTAIFMHPALLRAGEGILLEGGEGEITVERDSWLFMVDPFYIRSDWPRLCRYLLMEAENGLITTRYAFYYPPINFSEMDTLHYQWTRANRLLPEMNFTSTSRYKSCCNFAVFRENEDETAILSIYGDTTKLVFVNDSLEYDLSSPLENLILSLLHYYYLPRYYYSPIAAKCDDLASGGLPPQVWSPTGGRLRIVRSVTAEAGYRLSFEFIEARFQTPGVSEEVLLPYHKIEKAAFGFCPG